MVGVKVIGDYMMLIFSPLMWTTPILTYPY